MNDTVAPAPPFLRADEVAELCAPLKQGHAQVRYLRTLLGVAELPRRPDGTPLVSRKLVEERLNGQNKPQASTGFNWSK